MYAEERPTGYTVRRWLSTSQDGRSQWNATLTAPRSWIPRKARKQTSVVEVTQSVLFLKVAKKTRVPLVSVTAVKMPQQAAP